jgi:MFS family permease
MIFTPRKINKTNLTPSEASQTMNPWFILAVLCIPVFLGSLDLTVVSAFLPELMDDLGITINTESLASTSWILISYLMAYSISLFAMGRVSDLVGRRKALAICLSLYIVGSAFVVFYEAPADLLGQVYNALGIEFETSLIKLHAIIGARAVAAFGAGAITSIALALVSDMFEADARATPLGIIAGTDTVGWLIGAAWGGLVVQFFPWKAIFLINIPLVFIAMLIMLWALSFVPQRATGEPFDFTGFFLVIGVLVAFNIGIASVVSTDSGIDLSNAIPAIALAGVFLVAFIWRERRTDHPLIDLRMFSDKRLSIAMTVNLLIGYAMFIALFSIPLLVNARNLDLIGFATIIDPIRDVALRDAALQTGMLMAAFTIPLALASVGGAWIAYRAGIARTTVIGLILASISFGVFWRLLSLDTADVVIGGLMASAGLGIGLTFTPVIVTALGAASDEQRGVASSLLLGFRMVGMTISTSTLSTFATQRINDLVVSTEKGRFIFELVEPANYSTVFSTTFILSTVQAISEIAFIGFILCGIAALPALLLPQKASDV